jgi:hypothetical protein
MGASTLILPVESGTRRGIIADRADGRRIDEHVSISAFADDAPFRLRGHAPVEQAVWPGLDDNDFSASETLKC